VKSRPVCATSASATTAAEHYAAAAARTTNLPERHHLSGQVARLKNR